MPIGPEFKRGDVKVYLMTYELQPMLKEKTSYISN